MNNGKLLWKERKMMRTVYDGRADSGEMEIHIPVKLPTTDFDNINHRIIDAVIKLLQKNHIRAVYKDMPETETLLESSSINLLKKDMECSIRNNIEKVGTVAVLHLRFHSQEMYEYILHKYFPQLYTYHSTHKAV